MPHPESFPGRARALARPVALALALAGLACGPTLKNQRMPAHVVAARPADFQVPDGTVVMHYYGAGGWGIQWRGTYVLAAPYFSNHTIPKLLASQAAGRSGLVHGPQIVPDVEAVRAGFAGTPVANTALVLVGHGHIDHAGDVPAFFGKGLITGKPVLVADRSTTNELAAMSSKFGCIAPIDYEGESGDAAAKCPVPNVRVTPIHSAHAPHVKLAGLEVAAFGGAFAEEQTALPTSAEDYRLGNTWAYLIDLLDADGKVAFRIHYVDAAASPPHAIAPRKLLADRDVDVHIGCVPGYDLAEEYPEGVLRHHHVRYVLAGHWEDFFQPRTEPLEPVRHVLDEHGIETFVDMIEQVIPEPQGVVPLNKSEKDCDDDRCGPHGKTWTLPVPGETFQFAAGPQAPYQPAAK